jgi:hypothetical protein
MSRSNQRSVSRRLREVQRRVEQWRKRGGGKGSRMPEELWKAAVEVARVEGIYVASRTLRLEYSRLKKRVASAETADGDGRGDTEGAGSGFVELGMSELMGGKAVVELLGREGERMRVEVTGTAVVDVVGLTRVFWNQQS